MYRILSIPVWRVADDNANLCILTPYSDLRLAIQAVESWGFVCTNVNPHGRKPRQVCFVTGQRGSPPEPDYGSWDRSAIVALTQLPGPRLLINTRGRRQGWTYWSTTGWPRVDLYAYPIRKNFIDIDRVMLDLAHEVRSGWVQAQEWRFRIGDAINFMTEQGVSVYQAVKLAAESTSLAEKTLYEFYLIAKGMGITQRNLSIPWSTYKKLVLGGQDDQAITAVGDGRPENVPLQFEPEVPQE